MDTTTFEATVGSPRFTVRASRGAGGLALLALHAALLAGFLAATLPARTAPSAPPAAPAVAACTCPGDGDLERARL